MYKKHDVIAFGKYEWIVLKVNEAEGTALAVMKEPLKKEMPYNEKYESITWEECTLRAYLNHNFYFTFTEKERARIVTTTIKNPDNKSYNTKGGNDTQDEIFLLSLDEAELMTEEERAVGRGWCLRSPGYYQDYAAIVDHYGSVSDFGSNVLYGSGSVRPAFNLKF